MECKKYSLLEELLTSQDKSPCKKPRISGSSDDEVSQAPEENDPLEVLPPEMLEAILRFLPFQVIASSMRLVSKRCKSIATCILNNAFLMTGTRIDSAMAQLGASMLEVKTSMDLLIHSKAYNTMEVIKSQYNMLRAVTWRYTHNPKRQGFRLCFYAGSILDNLDDFLRKAKTQPSALSLQDSSMETFVGHCKRFMNYFERVTERKINKSPAISGCKIVDLLDCLTEGRQVLAFRVSSNRCRNKGGIVSMRLKYVIKRGWFTCLEVPKVANEDSWWEEQRYMYLRLRRLVGSVNEHLHETSHYDREILIHVPSSPAPKTPPASTYSGFGEYGGRFFFYGNMNRYAYDNKVRYAETIDLEDPENEDTEDEEVEETPYDGNDLVVTVELRCSAELAPLAVRSDLTIEDLEPRVSGSEQLPELYLKLSTNCPSSIANRLPSTFHWEVRTSRRTRD